MKPVYYNPRFLCTVIHTKRNAFRKKDPEVDEYAKLMIERAEYLLRAEKPNYGKVYRCYEKAAEAYGKAGNWHKQKENETKAAVNLAKYISNYWAKGNIAEAELKKLTRFVKSLTLNRADTESIIESLYPHFEILSRAFENSVRDPIPDLRQAMRKVIENCYEIAKKLADLAPDRFEPRVMALILGSKIVGKIDPDQSTEISRTMERTAHKLIAIYRDEEKTNIPAANEIASALNRNKIPNDIMNGRVTTIWTVSVPYEPSQAGSSGSRSRR